MSVFVFFMGEYSALNETLGIELPKFYFLKFSGYKITNQYFSLVLYLIINQITIDKSKGLQI